MFADDDDQQQSRDSFRYMSVDLTNLAIPRDELSDIMTSMSKTLHTNSPEQTMDSVDMENDDEPVTMENKLSSKPSLIDKLQTQLIHNQMRRTQARDYTRILCQSNTPAVWYKTPPAARSVYVYDPNYQKNVQQRSILYQRTNPNDRSAVFQPIRISDRMKNRSKFFQESSTSPFTPRTKYMINIYRTAVNHHQKKQNYHPTSSTARQSQTIPSLPPINTANQRNNLLTSKEKLISNHQSTLVESKNRFNQSVMPSTLF